MEKEITRKNLERVLKELPLLSEQMPEIKQDFNMGIYGVYNCLKRENLSQCNTCGCLLGNSARVFKDEFTNDLFKNNNFNYNLFGFKFFPYLYGNVYYGNIRWGYLFSGSWGKTKFGDLKNALQRIKNLLDNDLECNKFNYRTNKIIN